MDDFLTTKGFPQNEHSVAREKVFLILHIPLPEIEVFLRVNISGLGKKVFPENEYFRAGVKVYSG